MGDGPYGPLPPPLLEPVASPLFGPRLELRRYEDGDVEQLAALVAKNREHLRPWMRWISAEPQSTAQRQSQIAKWNAEAVLGGGAVLGCFLGATLIGSTGLHRRRPDSSSLEIGYWLDEGHQGRGYATETVFLLCEEAFSHDEIERVAIYCDDANEQSAAVGVRCGFRFLDVHDSPEGEASPGESGRERRYEIDQASFDPAWRRNFSG
jgi:ribosomal-protein-serine acetyltransferase